MYLLFLIIVIGSFWCYNNFGRQVDVLQQTVPEEIDFFKTVKPKKIK